LPCPKKIAGIKAVMLLPPTLSLRRQSISEAPTVLKLPEPLYGKPLAYLNESDVRCSEVILKPYKTGVRFGFQCAKDMQAGLLRLKPAAVFKRVMTRGKRVLIDI
jgi:hypothetical protein